MLFSTLLVLTSAVTARKCAPTGVFTTSRPASTSSARPTTTTRVSTSTRPSTTTSAPISVVTNNTPVRPVVCNLVFDPPTLSLNERSMTNSVRVRMSAQPTGNVNIAFPFSTLRFDTCGLTFTSSNWNTWQTIRLAAPPVFTAAKPLTYNIPFTVREGDRTVGSCSYPVNRVPVAGPVGSSSGDPHYTQFNRHTFTDQLAATVYLVNHQDFSVQALQQRCNPNNARVTCNQAVAVRYGSSAMVIDARDNTVRVGRLTSNTDNIIYTSSKSNAHVLTFPDGSSVSITASSFSAQFGVHISVSVSLAPHWSNYGGILGEQGIAARQYRLPDGKTTTSVSTFSRAWVVPPSDNLFNGNVRRATPSFTPNFCSRPATLFTDSLPRHTVRYTVANPIKRQVDTETNGIPDFDAMAKLLPKAFLDQASRVCNATISTSACAAVAETAPVIDSCYRDAIISQTLDFTGDHLQNFNQICLGMTRSLEEVGSDEATFQALIIQQQAGLGEFPCAGNCNSRGKCLEFGCECNAGFSGSSCEIKL